MRNLSELVRLILAPSLSVAQSSASEMETRLNAGHTSANTYAKVRTPTTLATERTRVLRGLTVKARERADRAFRTARQDAVPEGPLITAMLEAWTTATTESQVIRAQQRTLARLQMSKEAMVRAGRSRPSDEAISLGAGVLAQGVTEVQLEELARLSSSDRSLLVAFETLRRLIAHGVPAPVAVAKVGVRLETNASDHGIRVLGATLATDARTNADAHQVGVTAGIEEPTR